MAKAAYWAFTDAEARKRGEQTGLDTLVVHAVNDGLQGMWGIFEVFFDTIVVCTLTAFVLLSSTTGSAVPIEEALQNISCLLYTSGGNRRACRFGGMHRRFACETA